MPVTRRQLDDYTERHAWTLLFDTVPRALAGPGDPRHVTHPLAAAGWTNTADPLAAQVRLVSPDGQTTLHHSAQPPARHAWYLSAPDWYAVFDQTTPVEIVAGLTDALIVPPPPATPEPMTTLKDADWSVAQATNGTWWAHSPDKLLEFTGQAGSWRFWAHDDGPDRIIWHASIQQTVAEHVLHSLVRALADTSPVQRGSHDHTAYDVTQEPSRVSPQDFVQAHRARVRNAARAARRTAATAPLVPRASAPETARNR
ncbi:DUF317 domain-containing protein [Streptomyces sp. MS19]|uniref:DUF317 domain-containing protein n=1 Tax=Streptomyces sp. MS19 TaxID=3385972 RepID=UPI0039A310EE